MHELHGQKNDRQKPSQRDGERLHQSDFQSDDLVIAGNGSVISQMKSGQAKKKRRRKVSISDNLDNPNDIAGEIVIRVVH